MISEHELERNCNPRSLQRARAIAGSRRNILTKQVRYEGAEIVISAFVASSSGWDDRYRTSVTFDEAEDAIVDYACTCPAYREYAGMCKHCAALLIDYNREPATFMGYRAGLQFATSPCIADFMRRADRMADDDLPAGSVDIEPTLSYGYGLWSASFKVSGPQASYVVKSLSDFARRMREGEHYAYGKKLAFTHVPSMLTARAQAVAQFIDRATAQRERETSFLRWRGTASPVGRDLDLSEGEVVELLDALDDGTITVRGTDYSTRSVTRARIEDGNPSLALGIARSSLGGYLLKRDGAVPFAAQGGRMYAWQGDVVYRCTPAFAGCADFLRSVYDSDESTLFVADADMPLFCATVLPAVDGLVSVDAPPEVAACKPVPCVPEFYFDREGRAVTVHVRAAYGDKRYDLAGGEEAKGEGGAGAASGGRAVSNGRRAAAPAESAPALGPVRDERAEAKAVRLAERYFGQGCPPIPLADEERAAALLFGGLAEFRAAGEVMTTPAFDRLIRDGKPKVTMGVSLAGDLINLTVSSDDLPPAELAALLSSYRKHKRYHRLRDGAFVNLAGFDLDQLDRMAADLGITAKELARGTVELPAFRAFYLDDEADLERDRSFTRYLENFRAVDELDYRVPDELADVLRPYQAEGFRWLSARCDAGFGAVLADEMGLGKSVQLIALLLARRNEARETGPSLVACPASLVYNWLAEFKRFAPGLRVAAVAGTKRERAAMRAAAFGDAAATGAGGGSAGGESGPCDVIVTSYDLLRIDAAEYEKRRFFCFALDEAQYIKNPATLTTRAVKRVHARHRFALTGTPMENRLSELWSIFDFLMPGLLGPYARFRERFEQPIVGGDEDVAARLQAAVGPFMLRRRKADVLSDLPDKLESVVYAPMEGQQLRLYQAHEQKLREELTKQHNERKQRARERAAGREVSTVEVLAELTRLRQLCCDPRLLYQNYTGRGAKLDAIMELVGATMDAGEKALVFSQFTSFLSLISDELDAAGVRYFTITGSTPKQRRLALVNAFNEDDTPVFLVSLKAGGTGLNLTGASVVIHADPWWNAAAQDQATDRAHRIGQTRVVSVQKVIAQGTIEERIVRLQEAKTQLADQVVGASGTALGSLSAEDLLELLEG